MSKFPMLLHQFASSFNSIQFNLDPIVELNLVRLKFNTFESKFHLMHLNSIQFACNDIQYFHSDYT